MTRCFEVIVPRQGVNDEVVTIIEWRCKPGDAVQRGQVFANVETSKAVFEVECEESGFFYPLASAGMPVSIRDVVALILPQPDARVVEEYVRGQEKAKPALRSSEGGRTFTEKARELVERHHVDPSLLPQGRIVREQDVLAILRAQETRVVPHDVPKRAVIYGASQGGLAVLECVRSTGEYEAVAFLDDSPELVGTGYHGVPVWAGSELEALAARGIGAVSTHIADSGVRFALRDRALAAGIVPLNVIHAKAVVAPTVEMGVANLIKAGAVIDAYAQIGDCCIIDNGVIIPHHNRIGDGCHLAPGVCLGGDCDIGSGAIVGIGAAVSARTRIGKNAIIGIGACVARDVPDNAIVEGYPARIVGERKGV